MPKNWTKEDKNEGEIKEMKNTELVLRKKLARLTNH